MWHRVVVDSCMPASEVAPVFILVDRLANRKLKRKQELNESSFLPSTRMTRSRKALDRAAAIMQSMGKAATPLPVQHPPCTCSISTLCRATQVSPVHAVNLLHTHLIVYSSYLPAGQRLIFVVPCPASGSRGTFTCYDST
jgi:hypothetical protein